MAIRYTEEGAGVYDGSRPAQKADGRKVHAKRRRILGSYTTVADAIGDQIHIGKMPIGAVLESITVISSASLGSSTIAIGTASTPGKYRAAATHTSAETPTTHRTTAMMTEAARTDPEDVFVTVGAAALPNGTRLVTEIHYTISA